MNAITIRTKGDAEIHLSLSPIAISNLIELDAGPVVAESATAIGHTKLFADGTSAAGTDQRTDHVAVIDHATGLMWAVKSIGDNDGDPMSQADCEKACSELRLLGHDDWRLPTRAELAALVDETRHEPAIDTALFPGVLSRWHWTSTPSAWSPASAWYVDFYLGLVGHHPPRLPRVRVGRASCRSVIGPFDPFPGATMKPITFKKIAADGSELPDTATDHVAVLLPDYGLTFTATSIVDSDVSHAECEAAAKALDLLGHTDWDLPTIEEYQLLIDRSRYSPAINTDFFRDIQDDWYWSKTPAAWSPASAWSVYFSYGYVSYYPRDFSGFALAVRRAGQ